MKHFLFVTITLLLLIANHSQAQTDWKLGGNPVTNDSRIGTNSGFDLIFETADTERMRLNDAGYFGIGTVTPSAKLHVVGTFRMDGTIKLGDWVDANAEEVRLVYTDQNGELQYRSASELIAFEAYKEDCLTLPGEQFPQPQWHSEGGQQYGIMYTGASCPARVGIGLNNPAALLHVDGLTFTNNLVVGDKDLIDNDYRMRVCGLASDDISIFDIKHNGETRLSYFGDGVGSPFTLYNGVADKNYLTMHSSGTIDFNYFGEAGGIVFAVRHWDTATEVSTDIAHLTADGKWWCQGVVVKHVPFWGDFVFDDDYDLKPLSEVEAYINENHHLPEIPSAAEVAENGIGVEEMLRLLTIKVEELTLHAIEQEKEITALKAQVDAPSVIETEKK